jgi:phosphoketolase
MVRPRYKLACSSLVLLLAGVGSVWAQEQDISCEDVPAAVRAAFEKGYPKATIKGCAQEVEDGKTAYEIASTEGETGRDVLFHADGTLILAEETTAIGNTPKPVQEALHKRYSDEEVTLAERVMRDGTVLYEFQVEHQGEPVEIVFDASGNEVKP